MSTNNFRSGRVAVYVAVAAVAVPVLAVAGIALKALFFPVHTAGNVVGTAYGVSDRTLNATNAIYNYEWFKQQKEDIDALGKKVETAQLAADSFRVSAGDRKAWTFEDKTEDARLQSVVTGLTNQLTQAIADYNARSKMADRAIFRDSLVPDFIDALTFVKK